MKLTSLLIIQYTAAQCVLKADCYHGDCINGHCVCDNEWVGIDCNTPLCVYGSTINDKCVCNYGGTLQEGYCEKSCNHGNFSISTGECNCNKGWRRAFLSDTLNWFKGVCNQFKCESSHHCALLLPNVKNPKCPIKGWNCYCSENIGYENDNAKCMSFMYWLSFSAFDIYNYLCLQVYWKLFSLLIMTSIPLGSRRFNCDHHRSWWNNIKKYWCKRPISCKGECVRKQRIYIRDDLSVSIYWFKSMIWWYVFSTCLIITLGFIWSIALWMLIAGILLVIGIILWIMSLSGGGGDCYCGDCYCCSDCYCGDCYCGDCCSDYNDSTQNNYIYTGGPMPNRNYTMSESSRCKCACVCVPLLGLLNSYPRFPDNILGGILGYMMGTHILNNTHLHTKRAYILSLTWLNSNRDLRNNTQWRKNVHEYLNQNYAATGSSPALQTINRESLDSKLLDNKPVHLYKHRECNVYTYDTPIPITKISESNQEFIENRECWICYEVPRQWHKWDCHHVFCQTCSLNMIDIDMPCALCRKVTNNIYEYPLEN